MVVGCLTPYNTSLSITVAPSPSPSITAGQVGLLVVGCLSLLPLAASFYSLVFYAKDFEERKQVCIDYAKVSKDTANISLVNLGKFYTYAVQQMVLVVVLATATFGLLVSACRMKTGHPAAGGSGGVVPGQVLAAPGALVNSQALVNSGAPGIVNPAYLVQQKPQTP